MGIVCHVGDDYGINPQPSNFKIDKLGWYKMRCPIEYPSPDKIRLIHIFIENGKEGVNRRFVGRTVEDYFIIFTEDGKESQNMWQIFETAEVKCVIL